MQVTAMVINKIIYRLLYISYDCSAGMRGQKSNDKFGDYYPLSRSSKHIPRTKSILNFVIEDELKYRFQFKFGKNKIENILMALFVFVRIYIFKMFNSKKRRD